MERKPPQQAPFIHPGVNPNVAKYQEEIAARRAGQLPKVNDPVGGGRGPTIPRLDGPAQVGMTMEQIGAAERRPAQMPMTGGIVEQGAPMFNPTPSRAPALNLTPADILPDDAKNDPAFQNGTGSMFAVSQPHLAAKYGVYRNGSFIPPQRLAPVTNKPQLRPETIEDLKQLKAIQQQQQQSNPVGALLSSDEEAERQAAEGPAGAAAKVGNALGDTSNRPLTEEERTKAKKVLNDMDEFDFDSFRQSMMKDILNNPEQKALIESRLGELDITDMIVSGYITQEVQVIPGKFSITFRSMSGLEDLEIKRMIMEESKALEVSDRYLLDKYSFMSIAMGLEAINGKPIGKIYDDKGSLSEDKFKAKLDRILRLPMHMLASIGLNQMWFEQRVRKLYVAEKVGNG